MRHKIGGSERIMRQPDIAVYDTISKSVQLAIYLYFIIVRLCPYFASKLFA